MANKLLQSIKFPGLSDTYVVPQIDDTLTQAGQAADAKTTGNRINSLKNDLNIIKKANEFVYASGKYININGNLAINEQYAYTDFVPCDTGTQICLIDIFTGPSALAYAFYSENNENSFISGQNNITGDICEITIPSTAAYVRFSSKTTDGSSSTLNPKAYVYNSKTISSKVEALQDNASEIETDVSELQSNVSNISKKISAITPEDTTFFDIYDFIKSSFVEYVSGMVDNQGIFQVRTDFALTSIKIKVEPNTTYVLEIPGANRSAGTSNDTGIFEGYTAYNTLTVTRNGDFLTFTTGSNVSYAVIYFYYGTYDMSHGIEGIHLYKDSVKTSTTPTVKLENLPASVKGNAEPLNILIFGDSITTCCNITIDANHQTSAYVWRNPSNSYVDGEGNTVRYSMWPKILKESEPCGEIRNYAESGASYKTVTRESGYERQNLHYQIDVAMNDLDNLNGVFEVDDYVPDIIIFALGTNDGAPNDTYESAMAKTVLKSDNATVDVDATLLALDETKFCESARKAFLRVKQAFPMAQIYCSLPIQRANNEVNFNNTRDVLKKIAERYGCVVIDGTSNSGIIREFNDWNSLGTYLKDGLHPNEKGQNLLARTIIKAIKTHYMPFGRGFN